MAITKSAAVSLNGSSVGSGNSVSAGTPYTGPWVDLTGAYAAQLSLQITNGGTGPTVAAQIQIQTANDYNSGSPASTIANYGGPLQSATGNSVVTNWSIDLEGMAVAAVRVVVSGNTGQAVTFQGDLCKVTAI